MISWTCKLGFIISFTADKISELLNYIVVEPVDASDKNKAFKYRIRNN